MFAPQRPNDHGRRHNLLSTEPKSYSRDPDAALTGEELAALFRPLRRDYARIVAATAHLPVRERAPLIQARIEAYSAALAEALGAALDDATARTLGEWARGGQR